MKHTSLTKNFDEQNISRRASFVAVLKGRTLGLLGVILQTETASGVDTKQHVYSDIDSWTFVWQAEAQEWKRALMEQMECRFVG